MSRLTNIHSKEQTPPVLMRFLAYPLGGAFLSVAAYLTLAWRWGIDPVANLSTLLGLPHGAWLAAIIGAFLAALIGWNGKRGLASFIGMICGIGAVLATYFGLREDAWVLAVIVKAVFGSDQWVQVLTPLLSIYVLYWVFSVVSNLVKGIVLVVWRKNKTKPAANPSELPNPSA
jgi:hypothetical protein